MEQLSFPFFSFLLFVRHVYDLNLPPYVGLSKNVHIAAIKKNKCWVQTSR